MKIVNTSRIPTHGTPDLELLFKSAFNKALTRDMRQYASRLYVQINNGKYARVRGRIYTSAIRIYRKGKPIEVTGYMKLFVFEHTEWNTLLATFIHELSHFRDWYNEAFEGISVPYNREKRAKAFTDKIIFKM